MNELILAASRRASKYGFFLAADIDYFRSLKSLNDQELSDFLGCQPDELPRLALCRKPRLVGTEFSKDVVRIAQAFGLKAERLAALIREVDVIRSLREASPSVVEESSPGFLMAARDNNLDIKGSDSKPDKTE